MSETTGHAPQLPALTAAHFSLAAIGLMWTLPFLQPYHHVPLTSFYGEWLALVLGLLALILLAGKAFWRAAPLPPAVLPLAGFIGLLGLQFALGQVAYGGQPLAAALHVLWAILLMVLACGLRRHIKLEGICTVLAWFLVVGGTVGAVFAMLQHFQISELPSNLVVPKRTEMVYGNLAQRNHLANYSSLALASLAYLYVAGRVHWAGVAAAGAALIFVIGLTGSRSAVLFLAALLGLAALYAWRSGAGGRRLVACIALFVATFAATQWLVTTPWLAPGGARETASATAPPTTTVTATQRLAATVGSAGAKSVEFREQLAEEAWEMFLRAPLLGVGWGQFPAHDFDYRARHGTDIATWPFNHAHNLVLHLLAETGIAGTALVAAAFLLWLWSLRRLTVDLQFWWLAAVLSVIAVQSLLEHPLWFAYFLGIAAVAMGLMSGQERVVRLERAGPPLAVVTLAAAALYSFSLLHTYVDFEQLFARGGPRPGSADFTSILSRAHRDPVLRPYAELAISSAFELDGERTREKLELNGRVMRFAPISMVAYRQAMLLALAGDQAAAARQFERAVRVYPYDVDTNLNLLKKLAVRHPAELRPLLELAALRSAEGHKARAKLEAMQPRGK